MRRILAVLMLLAAPAAAQSPGTVNLVGPSGGGQPITPGAINAAVNAALMAKQDYPGGGGTPANPTATAGPAAVNGSALTYMRSDAAPAIQKGSNAQFGIVEGDGTTLTCIAGVCSSIGGVATSVTPGTTTVVGATAPCLIENTATTVMGCAPVTAGNVTALGITTGSAGAPVLLGGVGGTPSSLTGTNITGTAAGLTAGTATVANGLKSATTTVSVSAATAPTSGQVLTATAGTTATWQTPGSGTAANPTATAGPAAVNGSATTYMRSDAAPLVQKATSGQFGIVEVDGTTITASGGVITAVGAASSSITPGTTTVVGGTAPCVIENTATTVMGCTAETGTGAFVRATSPTLVTPALGTPASGVATNLTGTAAGLTAGTATVANGLKSATTTVSVSAATAPTNGQVLTATSGTTATWQTGSGGSLTVDPTTPDLVITGSVLKSAVPSVTNSSSTYTFNGTGTSGTGAAIDNTSTILLTASSPTFALGVSGGTDFAAGVGAIVMATGTTPLSITSSSTICGQASPVSFDPKQPISLASDGAGDWKCMIALPPSIPSGTIASGKNVGLDSSNRLVTATVGSGAASITPGTTTVVGSTAPCVIENSTSTTMACTAETGTGSFVRATSPTLVTPVLGTPTSGTLTNATGLPIATGVSGLGTGVATALAVNVGSAGAPVVLNGAGGTPSSLTGTNITGIPNAAVAAAPLPTPGTSATLVAPRSYYVCTGTCTVTLPTPAAGYEFCVRNDDNVATVITFAAITSVQFENTNFTSYKTANTSIVSGGAAGDKLCVMGRDATHYLVMSFNGTWS